VLALLVVTAVAGASQGPTITASNYSFTASAPTITAGETVTFLNGGGLHNFAFADGVQLPPEPALPTHPSWTPSPTRRFDQPGRYEFVCEAHAGIGMTGAITVQAAGSPPPGGDPQPSPPPPGGDPQPSPPGGTAPALEVQTLRTDGRTFCTKRGPACRRPGVRVRIDLSAAAPVAGTLTRRARRFGRVRFGTVAAGPRTLRFTRTASGRRLTAGRYELALTIGTLRRTLRFRVR
jgi:plastocyanin